MHQDVLNKYVITLCEGDYQMSAQNRYTKIIESLVNGDEASASELLHEAFVEKARDIWAEIVEQDEIIEDEIAEEELEEAIGNEEADDFIDDIESDEDEIEAEEAFGEADDEDEGELDAEMELADGDTDMDFDNDGETDDHEEEHEDLEQKMVGVEDALADLKAEFAKIMGDGAEEEPEEDSEEEVEEMTFEADESEEDDDAEDLEEAADLTKIGKDGAVHPIDMPAGDDGKASPVINAGNDMAKPHPTDNTKEAGGKVAAPKDMGVTHPGEGADLKPETRGHGAEKKGKAE